MARRYRITEYGTVGSTNDLAKEAGARGEGEGAAFLATAQTAGRGRLQREFSSPEGSGMYLSVLLRPKFRDPWLITVAAAVAASDAARSAFGIDTSIKWVNDLYLGESKVGGILTEAAFGAHGIDYAVLGIGVNIAPPEGGFPEALQGIAGALFEKDAPENAPRILAEEFLGRFFELYDGLPETPFIDAYRERSYLTGRTVLVPKGNELFEAEVLGVSDDFGLMVRYRNGGTETLATGEVSVKGFRQKPRLL